MAEQDGATLPYHPVADIFPLMQGAEFDALCADIAENGLREAIWLHPDGRILDGRNRYRACLQVGVKPEYRTWNGNGSLTAFVVSLNLHRRHLDASQRAVIALDVLPMLEAERRERQRMAGALYGENHPKQELPEFFPEALGEAREQAGQMLNVNPRYISDAKRIAQAAPGLIPAMRAGEMSITEAKRAVKEMQRESVREVNRQLVEQAPELATHANGARYATLVLDPPWDWGDEGDVDQFGRARPVYDTMPIGEIADLPVADLAQPNAHIYLWITNRSLPKGFALLEQWGFRYITTLTWCKPHYGMGNYFRGSTEQVLFGVRGSLPLLRHDVGTWFAADRPGVHSGKPAEFYALVEQCSPGPWLEMFARRSRPGWVSWGAEV